ncbi:MAG: SpoIIE family protein phosphatase [Lentisphaeria bacterium]|nr:SpoIIE family protein phosphatase [Lentisphaeria bacterium]
MKRVFQTWLLLVVSCAFLLTFSISYFIHTKQSRRSASEQIRLKLADAQNQLTASAASAKQLLQINEDAALLKARFFAEKLRNVRPAPENLARWKEELDVEELYVVAPDGRISAASSPEDAGMNLHDVRAATPVVAGLKRPGFSHVVTFSRPGEEFDIVQYAAVSRLDAPGVVCIVSKPERVRRALEIADIRNFAEGFRIGRHGGMLVVRDGDIICDGTLDIPEKKLAELDLAPEQLGSPAAFDVEIDGVDYVGLAARYGDYTVIGVLPDSEVYFRRNVVQSVLVVVYLLLFALIFVLVTLLISRIVLTGIRRICASLEKITNGDLTEKVDVHHPGEFDILSSGINSTVSALKGAIADAARRLDNELALAHAIQSSALPRQFPAFPGRPEFDIFAAMKPAKEIGGDFYDFFLIDERHLAFLVADVSEKGIPAALFMMSGKTWLKSFARAGMKPADLFTESNRMLSFDNGPGMFITVFFGLLDLGSGELTCVNAGHNPPLLKRADGSFEYLCLEPDFILGTLPGIEYHQHELRLFPGDRLFLYTDGVTEAAGAGDELYGTERLQKHLDAHADLALEPLVESVFRELAAFSAEQTDDITMLGLDFRGSRLVLEAEKEKLPELQRFVDSCCGSCGDELRNRVQVIAEEIFLNIAHYAYAPGTGPVSVGFLPEGDCLVFEFRDSGAAFDPLAAPAPEFPERLDDRTVGGLGIFMARSMSDKLEYRREEGENILKVTVNR